MAKKTPPVIPKINFPGPAGATGTEFSTAGDLLQSLDREASGLYLVGGNDERQDGYDKKIKDAYDLLKGQW